MLNNLGIMPFVVVGALLLIVYGLQIRPAQKRAKQNSTSTMYELPSSFWTGWGILLAGGGGYLLYALSDPQMVSDLISRYGPQEAGSLISTFKTTGYVLLGFGILLFGLGLAKSIFTPARTDQ